MGAAALLHAVETWTVDAGGVATAGIINTDHTVHAVTRVPERCDFALEYRHHRDKALEAFCEAVDIRIRHLSRQRGVDFVVEDVKKTPPTLLDIPLMNAIHAECGLTIASGAGHDAAVFQENGVRAGMIFVRNRGGSHNPAEHMDLDDFVLGVRALDRVLRRLADDAV